MDIRRKLDRDIEKQKQKISELQTQLNGEENYLRAQIDMLRLFPKTDSKSSEQHLRPGSDPARVRDILKAAEKPMHISEILTKLGKPQTVEARSGLSGTLGIYVRRGEIFTRPAPNTFGLIDPENSDEPVDAENQEAQEPPDDFGTG